MYQLTLSAALYDFFVLERERFISCCIIAKESALVIVCDWVEM